MKFDTTTTIILAIVAFVILKAIAGNGAMKFTGISPQRGAQGTPTGLYGPSDGLPLDSGVAYS